MSGGARRRWLLPVLLALAAWAALQGWQSHRQGRVGDVLAASARPGDILMLSSQTCVYCDQARRWLERHRVSFTECFIERDIACANAYRAQGEPGTPTLLVRGQQLVGFDPQQVARALAER